VTKKISWDERFAEYVKQAPRCRALNTWKAIVSMPNQLPEQLYIIAESQEAAMELLNGKQIITLEDLHTKALVQQKKEKTQ
jgi:hypothetical protein